MMYEIIPHDEASDILLITELSERLLDFNRQPVRRGQHPKQHGCVQARFVVGSNLPPNLAIGVFAKPRTFPCWIRFSNGSQNDDRRGDVHGMAIKLMDVEGNKLLEAEQGERTQDFVLMDNPAFFGKDARSNRSLVASIFGSRQPSIFKTLLFWLSEEKKRIWYVLIWHYIFGLRFKELKVLLDATSKKPLDPLAITYWSATPYLHGEGTAVKFRVVPVGVPPINKNSAENIDSPDRLQIAMVEHLRTSEARFEFQIQKFVDVQNTPIENASVAWNEEVAPFITLAMLIIPMQKFDSTEQMSFGENLSFTPWHSLPEHRPLGGVNRARRVIYSKLSEARHRFNNSTRCEPSFNDHPIEN